MLEVRNVSKSFGGGVRGETGNTVLDDVSLTLGANEILTIVGPSGCGKSTLLKCIAGLSSIDGGEILVGGAPIVGPGPDRSVVFQHPSLLPWRTAAGNVAYGMQMQRRFTREQQRPKVDETLELVGLGSFGRYYPGQLSGGMQQRVNLARALATDPEVLLMDEPFGALDALTKEHMHTELARIVEQTRKSVLFITHDIEEALFLSDRVCVMTARPGRIGAVVDVPFPRPRGPELYRDPEFQRMRYEIRALLGTQDDAAA